MLQSSLEGMTLIPRPVLQGQRRKQNQEGAARHGVRQRSKEAAVEPEGLSLVWRQQEWENHSLSEEFRDLSSAGVWRAGDGAWE